MKTYLQCLEAAVASILVVEDPAEAARFTSELQGYRDDCPYFGFIDQLSSQEFPFRSELALVLTRKEEIRATTSTKQPTVQEGAVNVRRAVLRSGNKPLLLPSVRLESRFEIGRATGGFGSPRDWASEIPAHINRTLAELFKRHVFVALFNVAEYAENVIYTLADSVENETREVLRRVAGAASVLCSPDDYATKFRSAVRVDVGIKELENGFIRAEPSIAPGVILIVEEKPQEVGFAQMYGDLRTSTVVKNYDELVTATAGTFGFCAWGDAPVTKLDFRPSVRA